jgi:hypothetical protein
MTRRSRILADQRLHHRMIDAHHRKAVERHVLDEGQESLLGLVERAVVIEMLGIDVGDDHHIGRQLDEGAVGLVRLDHHPVALAEPRIGAIGVDDAAVDDSRIEAARHRATPRPATSSSSCRACRRWRHKT